MRVATGRNELYAVQSDWRIPVRLQRIARRVTLRCRCSVIAKAETRKRAKDMLAILIDHVELAEQCAILRQRDIAGEAH